MGKHIGEKMVDYVDLHWIECEKNIIQPVWRLHHSTYEIFGLEYGDFIGISYEILKKEMPKYNKEKSGIITYGIRILKTRMADYIRNNYQTDKTKANCCPQSLNVRMSNDSETEIESSLVDRSLEYEAENNVDKIKRFLKTLSYQQKEILLLSAIGLDGNEIQFVMNISRSDYEQNMRKIEAPRRISILRNGVN